MSDWNVSERKLTPIGVTKGKRKGLKKFFGSIPGSDDHEDNNTNIGVRGKVPIL